MLRNDQVDSGGISSSEIVEAVAALADPQPGLRWLDVGCGTGDLARAALATRPADVTGVDVIDWLAADLRPSVTMVVGPAEETLRGIEPADRVCLVEVIEHLDAPWAILRQAAELVRPGGVLVASSPNIATLRSRADLLLKGRLTAFRPDNRPHFTPALPHVTRRVLEESDLVVDGPYYAGRDVIPLTRGRRWPARVADRAPVLTKISAIVVARRPGP